jgi:hypothetical protein
MNASTIRTQGMRSRGFFVSIGAAQSGSTFFLLGGSLVGGMDLDKLSTRPKLGG